jgi:hypothetical protein
MPAISQGDKKILLAASVAFVVLVVLGFLLAPSNTETNIASSYSTASGGAKAAFLLLQQMGYHVERWSHPPTDLKADKHTVLIVADPQIALDGKQLAAIQHFISGGGRVITNGIVGARFLPEDGSDFDPMPKSLGDEFDALTPSALTRAAPKIKLAPLAHWSKTSALPLYGDKEQTVAVRYVEGDGDAIWLAAATPLTNAGIQESGNLEFLLAAIGPKDQTHVLFDEFVHGYGEGEYTGRSHPIVWALLLQSVVLALALLLTFARRSGPLRPIPAPTRLAPLEFVETLGGLYQHANAAAVAVDVNYQRFQYWITRRFGLNPNASPEELSRAVRDRWNMKDDEFLATLQAAAAARYQPDLPKKEALKIVQSLHSYAVKLKLFPAAKENA